MYYFVYSDF